MRLFNYFNYNSNLGDKSIGGLRDPKCGFFEPLFYWRALPGETEAPGVSSPSRVGTSAVIGQVASRLQPKRGEKEVMSWESPCFVIKDASNGKRPRGVDRKFPVVMLAVGVAISERGPEKVRQLYSNV